MISKNEINKLALDQKVRTSTIDKDWALGHFIDAMYTIHECRNSLIFKGGTCIRKCLFPHYRFSEDLDFTAANERFVFDMQMLRKIIDLITDRTKMPLSIQSLEKLKYNNHVTGYCAKIMFWGADHGKNQQPPNPSRWQTSIKIEVILYEKMFFAPESATVLHPYSDHLTENAKNIPVYHIHEVLSEKIRALIQRSYSAPRDYYDIWYLYKHIPTIDWGQVVQAFYAKAEYKGLRFAGIEQFINIQNDKLLKTAWKNSLEHQITTGSLPDYDSVRTELWRLFTQIF